MTYHPIRRFDTNCLRRKRVRYFSRVSLWMASWLLGVGLTGCKPAFESNSAFLRSQVKHAFEELEPFSIEYCFIWAPQREGKSKHGSLCQLIRSESGSVRITKSGTIEIEKEFVNWLGFISPEDISNLDAELAKLDESFVIKNADYMALVDPTTGMISLGHMERVVHQTGREILFWGFCAQDWTPYWALPADQWVITPGAAESDGQKRFLFARHDGQWEEEVVFSSSTGRCISRRVSKLEDSRQTIQEHFFHYPDERSVLPNRIDFEMDGQPFGFLESRNFTQIDRIDPETFRLSHYGLSEPPIPKRESRATWLVAGGMLATLGIIAVWWMRRRSGTVQA